MVNPFAFRWFWLGLKGHSVTFAALFASLVLGASISGLVHRALAAIGVHWLYALILPVFLFGWLSKREARWIPDERKRKLYARSLLAVSLALALLVGWLRPTPDAAAARPAVEERR